jgi:hypothetical protein
MRDRRELRSFGFVMVLIAAVSVTALVSCGGGSDGGTDGTICAQCGDSDGLCLEEQTLTDERRPSFCDAEETCTVRLRCLRKLDSAQRRCFPADPATNELDLRYECDGSRPNPSVAPTTTATPSATATPEPSLTPSATAITPTPTVSPTTAATATPDGDGETEEFDITIEDPDLEDLPATFTGTVTYPPAKGSFRTGSTADCEINDAGLTAQDDGSGTLTLSFDGDTADLSSVSATCTFHLSTGQTISTDDLHRTANPSSLSIEVN